MDGLAFVTAIRDTGANYAPIGTFVAFALTTIERGHIVATGVPGPQHYNPLGVVHGGFASTLLDLALGHVSISVLRDPATGVATTDLNVKYLRSMNASTGTVICEATVVHAGRRIVVAQAELRDAGGTLFATAQSTCIVLGPQP
ncbi:MAG TPA: PaaI family thioesterase [Candidatus Baltobacteraceae bacterium]|jgi:uncharacterized protein (TIGR00369 family)